MRTQHQPLMGKKAFVLLLVALVAASLACSLVGGRSAAQPTSDANSSATTQGVPTTGTDTTGALEPGVPSNQTGATEAFWDSFPLPADTVIDSESVSEDDPDRGSFALRSTAALDGLVDFYKAALPPQGWTYRYTDANYLGGVTQYWKKEGSYLLLQFGYDKAGAVVTARYQRVAADALEKLPRDLPIPDNVELTNTSHTSWDSYVDQDYAAVVAFYTHASTGWARCPAFGEMSGEGDGGPGFPPGASPMPAPTQDSRPMKAYCWILPSQNQVELTITPHGAATLLHISLTSLNVSESGLPADVPIYPGATIQSATPGMVTFQAGASLEKVRAYYEKDLKAAGWTSEGQPFESAGMILVNWKKGSQSIMITISAMGADDCAVAIASEGS
jgi:hypothetical protein